MMHAGTNEHDTMEYDVTSCSQYPQCHAGELTLTGCSYRKHQQSYV